MKTNLRALICLLSAGNVFCGPVAPAAREAESAGQGSAPKELPCLWYQQPAADAKPMNEALPIGNGRLGALVFGSPQRERLSLNEDMKSEDALVMENRAMVRPLAPWQGVEPFDKGWLYLEKDINDIPSGGDWQAISLPHCWNAGDTLVTNSYRRGNSWYRHALKVTEADLGKRLFLRFGAAGMDAAVFVNGARAANHLGAYSAFTVELTQRLKPGDNQIDVRVCNRGNPAVPPVADGLFNFYDVIAYNLYCGWYGGTVEKLAGRLEALHKLDPSKPLILSEFGAGCDLDKHSESPKCFDQTQEYQLYFLESYLRQLDAMPRLAGYNWWNFADFGWANSKIPKLYDNKGLVTFDRQKKDSFYFVKAAWSREPVLYLCSPTWTERTGLPDKPYRVISNMQEVELFLNGKTLGKQTSGFVWDIKLAPGTNRLLARGFRGEIVREHGFTVIYTPGNDASSGMAPADLLKQAIESNPIKAQK
jgi:hypothetical protein